MLDLALPIAGLVLRLLSAKSKETIPQEILEFVGEIIRSEKHTTKVIIDAISLKIDEAKKDNLGNKGSGTKENIR